jgi:putative ABC transport system permease protein
MILDLLKYSLSNIWVRKLRSGLTVLSILIGVAAIYTLLSFGQGINKYVNDFAQQMGSDKVMMMPGGGLANAPGTSNLMFTQDDLDFIRKINGVSEATGMMIASGQVKFKDYREKYPYIAGLSTDNSEQRLIEDMFGGIKISEGRQLKKGDVLKAVLGYSYTVPNKMFKRAIVPGDKIEINDVLVDVVGFYEEIGNPGDDSNVYMSQEGFEAIFDTDEFEYIYIRVAPDQNPSEMADRIKEKFRKRRGEKEGEEDFTVQTFEDTIAAFTSVINILNGVLVLIALISVIVAAVNIMNTMYTSVLERTREIGVMKSIGSRNRQILNIFVIESGILGLFGGVIGVIIGYTFAKLGQLAARLAGLSFLKPYFPWWLTVGSLIFAFSVGALSGLLPAIQASKQKPVEALRYE